nr:hypothetical protein [Bacillota bacterium]
MTRQRPIALRCLPAALAGILALLLAAPSVWAAGAIQVPLITEPQPIAVPPVTHETLANGLQVWVVERHEQPIALFTLVLPRGKLADPPGKEGLAAFTAALLKQGTTSRTAEEIAEAIEFVGGSLTSSAGTENTVISAQVVAKDAALALELMADVVLNPTFPEAEVALLRQQFIGAVRQQKDDPLALASVHAAAFFYGAGHRLGRPETEESYTAMTRDDIVAFHRDHYGPREAIFLAVGDLDPQWVVQEVERLFGSWQGPAAPPPEIQPVTRLEASRVRWVARPGQTQVQVRLRQNGPARTAEEWVALQVANQILGSGGFASRLMQAIRSDLGQTYGIWSQYTTYRFPGAWELATFTRNESLWATLEAIHTELRRFAEEGVTEEELAKAKSQLLGRFPLQLETLAGTAALVTDAILDHGSLDPITDVPEQVAALTLADVNGAIRAHLDPERFAVVLLGDPAVLETAPGPIFGVPREQVEIVDWTAPVRGYRPGDR